MLRPSVVIVSPAAADANNGNARTAARWQAMLADTHDVRVVQRWPDANAARDEVMLALHARRSAEAIHAWADERRGPLVVALTGTDLYHDIAVDAYAKRSVELADRLVVLQECGPDALPAAMRGKARVVFQSAPAMPPAVLDDRALDVIAVGHLRSVKSPETLFEAARLLRPDEPIRITHIGDDRGEPALGEAARGTQRGCSHYRWLGSMAHEEVRERIRSAHLLVHPSEMEGGAHVVLEAVRSGTAVLASRVSGNVGMLGTDYGGYFPHGDAAALVALLRECRATQGDLLHGKLAALRAQCALRSPLFDPAAERAALLALLLELEPSP